MLTSLRVKNLALVEDLRVEFGAGLNMITGETGAGKSILIGALGMVLGERADKSLIRAGQTSCVAEAMFDVDDPAIVDDLLDALGLDPLVDGQLIVRRVMKQAGATQQFINDQAVSLQAVKQIGERLVDIHGPYDHQSLLSPEAQRDLLDAFGSLSELRKSYAEEYQQLRALEARREEIGLPDGDVSEQMDLLSFKVKELEEAHLSVTEEEEVAQEHAVFGHAQRIVELASGVALALSEGETSAMDLVGGALRQLDELSRLLPEAEDWQSELDDAATRIREITASLASRVDGLDADPSRLEWLDQRLTTYQKLKRKYGPTVADCLEQLERAQQRLQDLQSRDERLAELEKQQQVILKRLEERGMTLHAARRKAATKLANAITAELKALGFEQGQFGVEVTLPGNRVPGPAGLDAVEFAFEPNLGEGMRPLRQIASSGEISRVMLATKAILARHDRVPVLVFDEIDANIGGETGGAVGRKLANVAAHHQILCITHLPQVAMYGSHHYAVRKEVIQERTRTTVVSLTGEDRVEEMARMLGGRGMTATTLAHARDMLEKATS